jgi:tetratricopeptide (TPR) repeat protein
VRLDQSLSEAQHQLGEVAFKYQWDWAGAERAYRQAIELNPSDSFARSDFARFLMAEERLEEALDQAKLAVEADPLSGEANSVVGLAYYYQRNYDEAIAERLKAIRLDPSSAQHHLSLGRAYAGKRAFDQAVAELEQAVALSGHAPFIMAELARTYAVAGRRAEAEGMIASLVQGRSNGGPHLPAQYETYMYAALGDFDRAFASLDQAAAEREPNLLWARVDPRFDALRQDPRFADFLRRLAATR